MVTAKGIRCVILGGGGHAHVVIDSLQRMGNVVPTAVLDADGARWGKNVLGVPVWGGDDLLPEIKGRGITHFVVGLGSIGAARGRRALFDLGLRHGLEPLMIIHPDAVCSSWARVGAGSQLLPASVINAGAVVGTNVIVNSGAIIEHHCVIGDHAHVATGSRLASGVRVCSGAHIGAGATVRERIVIGEGAIVGAGAVVVKDVAANTVVVGVPARLLRSMGAKTMASETASGKERR